MHVHHTHFYMQRKGSSLHTGEVCCSTLQLCPCTKQLSCLQANKPAAASAQITDFFSQQKNPAASTTASAKGTSELPAVAKPNRPFKGLASLSQPGHKGPVPAHHSFRSSLQSQAQPDLAAQNQPGWQQSFVSSQGPETEAGSSHDAEPEELQAFSTSAELSLQSPYARRLRQEEKAQADSLSQQQPSLLLDSPPEAFEDEVRDLSCRAGQHGTSLAGGLCGDASWAAQSSIGAHGVQSPDSPGGLFARLGSHRSPKRGAAADSHEVIVISPDSQTQDELEINLLSASPAKR